MMMVTSKKVNICALKTAHLHMQVHFQIPFLLFDLQEETVFAEGRMTEEESMLSLLVAYHLDTSTLLPANAVARHTLILVCKHF